MSEISIIDDKLTQEQIYSLQSDVLNTSVDNNTNMGVASKIKLAKSAKTLNSTFVTPNRTIIRALNSLGSALPGLENSAAEGLAYSKEILGDTSKDEISQKWTNLKAVLGESTLIEGLLKYFLQGLNINLANYKGNYDDLDSATTLNVGDIVTNNGVYYTVKTAFTKNTSSFDDVLANFEETMSSSVSEKLSKALINKGEYAENTTYEANDVFRQGSSFYLVTERGTSTAKLDDFSDHYVQWGGAGIMFDEIEEII